MILCKGLHKGHNKLPSIIICHDDPNNCNNQKTNDACFKSGVGFFLFAIFSMLSHLLFPLFHKECHKL